MRASLKLPLLGRFAEPSLLRFSVGVFPDTARVYDCDNYEMQPSVRDLLGGETVLGPGTTNLDLARATRNGLPARSAIELASGMLQSAAATALGPFGVILGAVREGPSARTRLTPEESDVVVRTARALSHATEVLGEPAKAVHWLTTPNQALGDEVPISLHDTSSGEHEVESLLDRIEYGVYS